MRLAIIIAVLATGAFWGGQAMSQGDPVAEAKEHYQKGLQYFELGRWDDAAKEFESAYTLKDDPAFLYNMAQAYRRKGDAKRALDLYKNFLIKDPTTAQRAEVEERIRVLKARIEAGGSQSPEPVSPEPTSALSPDAGVAGSVDTGTGPRPDPDAGAVSPMIPSVDSGTEIGIRATLPDRGRGLRLAGLVTGGVGLACLGTGAFMSYRTQSLSDNVSGAARFDPQTDRAGKIAETLQWVFYGAGAVAVISGGVLYFAGLPVPAQVVVVPTQGGVALSTMGVFYCAPGF